MKQVEILPLQGIDLEGEIQLRFGQAINEIITLLGQPTAEEQSQLYYADLELRIDFDSNYELEFIQFERPFTEKVILQIYNVNPFTIEANKLIGVLTAENKGKIDESEEPYSYCFTEISIGIWREFVEEDVQSNIEELKNCGVYEASKEWIEQDLEKSKFFWTIGIGKKNYYK
jgi:hypothetical protein